WYPYVASFVRSVGEGARPFWDPFPAFGLPALANPNVQLAYPPTWLNLLLPPAVYYKLFALGHVFAAGLGLMLLARRFRLRPVPPLVAGAGWATSGPLLSSVNLFHPFAGLCWMPWVLLAGDWALERRTVGSALVLGATLAGQMLAGSAD